jgi:hypothetical protein
MCVVAKEHPARIPVIPPTATRQTERGAGPEGVRPEDLTIRHN